MSVDDNFENIEPTIHLLVAPLLDLSTITFPTFWVNSFVRTITKIRMIQLENVIIIVYSSQGLLKLILAKKCDLNF